MFANKKACYDTPEKCQVQSTDGKQSSVEQALSNLLILDTVFKYLDAQDVICASMVNRSLRGYSLEFLRNNSTNKKLHFPVCIQIRDDSPCRALLRFNTYLMENESNDQDQLNIDGIQQAYPGNTYIFRCADCLIYDWDQTDSMGPSAPPTIEDCYGKILEKIKFKYIRFNVRMPTSCPFALFIQFIISKHAEEILELDFGDERDNYGICNFYLKTPNGQKVFPSLEILGIEIGQNNRMPIVSPVLKKIKHFTYMGGSNDFNEYLHGIDFPFHALTILHDIGCNLDEIKNLVKMVKKFCIRPESLEIIAFGGEREEKLEIYQKDVYRKKLFELGQLVCSSLTKLSCPLIAFPFVAGKGFILHLDNDVECNNTFVPLKSLELRGWLDVDILDSFSLIDFQRNFPQLKQIVLTFLPSPDISDVSGPYNKYHGCVCNGVKRLTLDWLEIENEFSYGRENTSRALNLFSYIRHLELKSIGLPTHVLREALSDICNEMENLPFLEEITLWFKSLIHLSLDRLFIEKEELTKLERMLGEGDLEHVWASKSPVLNHKRFTRIIIESLGVACLEGVTPVSCYSDEPPDRFVVSGNTAKNICKYRPGFQIHLRTRDVCKAAINGIQCSNNVGISGLRFEHLEPYTTITTSEIHTFRKSYTSTKSSTLRVIAFVGGNQLDDVSA